MICPLCGHKFEEFTQSCAGCPLNSNCNLICCPNCGYKYAQESKIINYFKKFSKKENKNATT